MKAEILNAFYHAAVSILTRETADRVVRTGLVLDPLDYVSDEVLVYVALVGNVRGMILIGMSTGTARLVAADMVKEPQPELTEMGLSALAELANLIAGQSTIGIERLGLYCDITPPTIMIGRRSRISTLGLQRFIIPLQSKHGPVNVHVAVDVVKV